MLLLPLTTTPSSVLTPEEPTPLLPVIPSSVQAPAMLLLPALITPSSVLTPEEPTPLLPVIPSSVQAPAMSTPPALITPSSVLTPEELILQVIKMSLLGLMRFLKIPPGILMLLVVPHRLIQIQQDMKIPLRSEEH